MKHFLTPIVLAVSVAGCNTTLTPAQQALVDQIGAVGVQAACVELERQYARVGNPTPLQQAAMGQARSACANPAATVTAVQSAAKEVAALLPPKTGSAP